MENQKIVAGAFQRADGSWEMKYAPGYAPDPYAKKHAWPKCETCDSIVKEPSDCALPHEGCPFFGVKMSAEEALAHINAILTEKAEYGEDLLLGSTAFKSCLRWSSIIPHNIQANRPQSGSV